MITTDRGSNLVYQFTKTTQNISKILFSNRNTGCADDADASKQSNGIIYKSTYKEING